MTSLYFGSGLTYYHYGKRDEGDGLFHSTHSEYKSDHRTFQRGFQSLPSPDTATHLDPSTKLQCMLPPPRRFLSGVALSTGCGGVAHAEQTTWSDGCLEGWRLSRSFGDTMRQ